MTTPIAPHISAFLQQRLREERQASANTCNSYAYAFKLLFQFAGDRFKVLPSALQFEQIDAALVAAFLNHLEAVRHNRPASRNTRLAAIKSFMQFMAYRLPAAGCHGADQARTRHSGQARRDPSGSPPNGRGTASDSR